MPSPRGFCPGLLENMEGAALQGRAQGGWSACWVHVAWCALSVAPLSLCETIGCIFPGPQVRNLWRTWRLLEDTAGLAC